MAKDYFLIEKMLGHENHDTHYPKKFFAGHAADAHGQREVTEGLLLVPTSEFTASGLESSTLLTSAMFADMPIATSVSNCTRKCAVKARRDLENGWEFKDAMLGAASYAQNKVCRGQLGTVFYESLLKDVVKHCTRKVLLVNDFIAGCGEVGVAAIGAKVSQEAAEQNVRVCYFGAEFRKTFSLIGHARVQTALGRSYLDGKLRIPGKVPVVAPTSIESGKKPRSLVSSLMTGPLKRLTLDNKGTLLLPRGRALQELPFQLTDDVRTFLEALEK